MDIVINISEDTYYLPAEIKRGIKPKKKRG